VTTLSALALGLLLANSAPVFAQDDARTTAAARALFQEGVACADRLDWPCAVDRFGSARALRASPVILSNYAIALAHVGRIVEAAEAYRSLARDPSAAAPLRADAELAIVQLEPRFARIVIHTIGSLDGVRVSLDGGVIASSMLDVAIPSDPGDHSIAAHRGSEVVATAEVHVESGASVTAELTIPDPRIDVSPATAASLESPRTDPGAFAPTDAHPIEHHEVFEEWWFWAIIGGVVAAGVGITLGVVLGNPSTTLPSGSLGTIDARP